MEWREESSSNRVTAEDCARYIKEAYTNSKPPRCSRDRTKPYWWTDEIENLRAECIRLRRLSTRTTKNAAIVEELRTGVREAYKNKKKELRTAINNSKKKCWETLCEDLNNDIWGQGYRIAMSELTNFAPYELSKEKRRDIATTLFPQREPHDIEAVELEAPEPFTLDELLCAAECLKNGKAPGPDGVPPEAVKEAIKWAPTLMLNALNDILRSQKFPDSWKLAKLTLILKKGRSAEDPTAYRPICLLNTLSKLYERMICNRLVIELDRGEGLSERQYGFRKGRSTVHAVDAVWDHVRVCQKKWMTLITLDIKNAFNSAAWDLIIGELVRGKISPYLINIVRRYFQNRRIIINIGEELPVTTGVPQGSVLGPTLWNVLYDGVLRIELTEGAETIAYADDLAIIATGKDEEELNYSANESLRRIDRWLDYHRLELAPEKSEAIILRGPRKKANVRFLLRGQEIIPKRSVKYLGIVLDDTGRFVAHIREITAKADERAARLARIPPNIGGPLSKKREVLYSVVQSILLYGAPVWHIALRTKKNRELMERSQRKMLLRVASAYRTVSAKAVQVITGVVPIHLLVDERRRLYEDEDGNITTAKRLARMNTLNSWQQEWETNEGVGQWTKKLIPDIRVWVHCSHRKTEYYLTQVLSGHGQFRTYTKRVGKTVEDGCGYCGRTDTPEHTLLYCERWERYRQMAYTALGVELDVNNIINIMLESRDAWNIVHTMIKKIMKEKEEEERIMQREEYEEQ